MVKDLNVSKCNLLFLFLDSSELELVRGMCLKVKYLKQKILFSRINSKLYFI